MHFRIFKDFKVRKTFLLLSPHYDDIAFSIGGLVLQLKNLHRLWLIILFGQTNYTFKCNVRNVNIIRNLEDQCFAQKINAYRKIYKLPDTSILKHTEVSEVLFNPFNGDSRYEECKKNILSLIEQLQPDFIFSPIGLGGHIDHRITFDIVFNMKIYERCLFYEDIPYVTYLSNNKINKIVRMYLGNKVAHYLFDVTQQHNEKIENIRIYESQVERNLIHNIETYSNQLNLSKGFFERIWFCE